MPHLLAQVRIPRDNNLPEDVSINTFHGAWDSVAQPDVLVAAGDMAFDIGAFYQEIDNLLSAKNGNPVEIRVYRMDDPEPRAPVLIDDSVNLTYGTTFLPSEVACCLTFHGTKISGEPQARRRGRIYLGPLADIQASGDSDAEVSASARIDFCEAAATLLDNSFAHDWKWSVYSQTDDALVPIVGGWVDNAFDTIRSRGFTATTRTLWPVVP